MQQASLIGLVLLQYRQDEGEEVEGEQQEYRPRGRGGYQGYRRQSSNAEGQEEGEDGKLIS